MDIKIGFSSSNSWISRLIRWLTSSDVSHTFLLVTIDGKEFVAEAAFSGFRLILKRNWDKDNRVADLFTPIVSLDKGWEAVEDWLGERYGYEGIFGYMWVVLGRMIKRKWHNPIHESKALFCSEANTKVLQESGWPGADQLDAASMSPGALRDFVKASFKGNL
jgi:hypothetical protein